LHGLHGGRGAIGELQEAHIDDWHEYQERAAVLEYDGGLARTEAETRAAQEAEDFPEIPEFLKRVGT